MLRSPRSAVLAALLASGLVLGACSVPVGERAPETETETGRAAIASPSPAAPDTFSPAPAGLEELYGQDVAWEKCDDDFECASVEVPMDYDAPDGERIEIALKRLPAEDPDARVGSLLLNPGGPGGSGTNLVEAAEIILTPELRAGFDVVGFDPRGVHRSSAVECVSDAELDEVRSAEYDLSTDEGIAEFTADAEDLAKGCAESTGPLLAHVDTVSAARDLDVLRHVLGDAQLHYLGYSYGTLLGATYADLFPATAGRLVLDGAVDPALGTSGLVEGQALGFENALHAFVEDCLAASGCPLSGDVDDAVGQVRDLLALVEATPLPTGSDRELTLGLAASGILLPLYEDAYWPLLSSALEAAIADGDGSQLLFLADAGAEREPDGTYLTNSTEAFRAINCLDYPVENDLDAMKAEAQRLEELSPTFGPLLAFGDIGCEVWPHESTAERAPIDAEGAAPILVIGTTGDPATPYEWSVSLADQLADATLLTYEGEGHTAYGRSNECVSDAVDAFLLEGTVPEDGLVC